MAARAATGSESIGSLRAIRVWNEGTDDKPPARCHERWVAKLDGLKGHEKAAIIGTRGATIKRLQDESKAKIYVAPHHQQQQQQQRYDAGQRGRGRGGGRGGRSHQTHRDQTDGSDVLVRGHLACVLSGCRLVIALLRQVSGGSGREGNWTTDTYRCELIDESAGQQFPGWLQQGRDREDSGVPSLLFKSSRSRTQEGVDRPLNEFGLLVAAVKRPPSWDEDEGSYARAEAALGDLSGSPSFLSSFERLVDSTHLYIMHTSVERIGRLFDLLHESSFIPLPTQPLATFSFPPIPASRSPSPAALPTAELVSSYSWVTGSCMRSPAFVREYLSDAGAYPMELDGITWLGQQQCPDGSFRLTHQLLDILGVKSVSLACALERGRREGGLALGDGDLPSKVATLTVVAGVRFWRHAARRSSRVNASALGAEALRTIVTRATTWLEQHCEGASDAVHSLAESEAFSIYRTDKTVLFEPFLFAYTMAPSDKRAPQLQPQHWEIFIPRNTLTDLMQLPYDRTKGIAFTIVKTESGRLFVTARVSPDNDKTLPLTDRAMLYESMATGWRDSPACEGRLVVKLTTWPQGPSSSALPMAVWTLTDIDCVVPSSGESELQREAGWCPDPESSLDGTIMWLTGHDGIPQPAACQQPNGSALFWSAPLSDHTSGGGGDGRRELCLEDTVELKTTFDLPGSEGFENEMLMRTWVQCVAGGTAHIKVAFKSRPDPSKPWRVTVDSPPTSLTPATIAHPSSTVGRWDGGYITSTVGNILSFICQHVTEAGCVYELCFDPPSTQLRLIKREDVGADGDRAEGGMDTTIEKMLPAWLGRWEREEANGGGGDGEGGRKADE
ncbi:unnamed protein product [Vitrella brassicaformis CCMP3155]|uniref:K Homology domain-containing protein n=2 Tax=Vitrella brassicaformis TaxID=1169539 RepID=A0A0G4G9Q0_VITBC|nr:unnamed protein product [Vitrella brassicaformis CCMP3155]|eukprot:CEM25247.1 unnamed protein product [Vitrella brassicaformis CCMP3155]